MSPSFIVSLASAPTASYVSTTHAGRYFLKWFCPWAALCACLLTGKAAQADTTIAGDLDFDVPVSVNDVEAGPGFGIRLGQQLHLPMMVLNPEIGFTYASFSQEEAPKVYRGIAGFRLGFGEIFRLGLFGHIGIGHAAWKTVPEFGDRSHTGFTYDVGLFFDLTALPFLNVGVHCGYNWLAGKKSAEPDHVKWLQIGAHAALVI